MSQLNLKPVGEHHKRREAEKALKIYRFVTVLGENSELLVGKKKNCDELEYAENGGIWPKRVQNGLEPPPPYKPKESPDGHNSAMEWQMGFFCEIQLLIKASKYKQPFFMFGVFIFGQEMHQILRPKSIYLGWLFRFLGTSAAATKQNPPLAQPFPVIPNDCNSP